MPMRIRLALPSQLHADEAEPALNAALEAVTAAQAPLIRRGVLPTALQGIKAGVRWKPEPPGDEHFDLASTVLKRKWGDCDDLAPWHAASLRGTGEDPEARAIVRRSGPSRWHAIVQRGDGSIDDPSKAAGMGSRVMGADDYMGPFWPSMSGQRLALAAYPGDGRWHARADIPDTQMPFLWSPLANGRSPRHAVVRAIRGAANVCGDELDGIDQLKLGALHDLLCGHSFEDVAGSLAQYGDEMVGFLPMLAPAAMSLAAPMLSKIMPGGGGGGGGGAPAPSGGGGAPALASPHTPGATFAIPGGPIIVRF